MKAIIDEIERGIGRDLAAMGLKPVYRAAQDADSEDDGVVFIDGEGRASTVGLQVSSLTPRPSLAEAAVTVDYFSESEAPGGWRHAQFEAVAHHEGNGKDLLAVLKEQLAEHAGKRAPQPGLRDRVVTHPLLLPAIEAVGPLVEAGLAEAATFSEADGEREGIVLTAADGRKARIEARPGVIAVIAGGEERAFASRDQSPDWEGLSECLGEFAGAAPRPSM